MSYFLFRAYPLHHFLSLKRYRLTHGNPKQFGVLVLELEPGLKMLDIIAVKSEYTLSNKNVYVSSPFCGLYMVVWF